MKRRAIDAHASDMRVHPDLIRHAFMACFLNTCTMKVTDDAVRLLLESIRRIEPQTEKHLHKALRWDIKRVHPHFPSVPLSRSAIDRDKVSMTPPRKKEMST